MLAALLSFSPFFVLALLFVRAEEQQDLLEFVDPADDTAPRRITINVDAIRKTIQVLLCAVCWSVC